MKYFKQLQECIGSYPNINLVISLESGHVSADESGELGRIDEKPKKPTVRKRKSHSSAAEILEFMKRGRKIKFNAGNTKWEKDVILTAYITRASRYIFRFRRALRLQGKYDALPSLWLNSCVLPWSLSFCRRSGEGRFCHPTLLPWCWSTWLGLTPAAYLSCRLLP